MPAIMKSVKTPHNADNFALPSRISMWFAPEGADGRLAAAFELGNVENVEVNITENWAEMRSARGGALSISKRLISENTGTISCTLTEVVSRNLEILFRPATVIDRNDTAGNSALLYESSRPRLIGTTATAFADPAVEGGVKGAQFFRELVIQSVRSTDGVDTYAPTTDYTFVNGVEGDESTVDITLTGFTAAPSDTLTLVEDDGLSTVLTLGTDIAAGTSVSELAANVARAINGNARSYIATSAAGVVTITHQLRDGVAPADVVLTGGLDTDAGGSGTYTFSAGTESTAPSIARVGTGGIPDGAEVVVTYTFLREACEYSLQDGIALEGLMRLQILSTTGPQCFYEFYKVSLAMNNATTVNPQEFMSAGIQATILTDGRGRRGRFVLLKKFPTFNVEAQGACV